MPTRTISRLWLDAAAAARSRPAYLVETEPGRWEPVSWREAAERVEAVAFGFLALGIGPGDRVVVLGRTRVEWAVADFALASIGAVTVPVYPTSSPSEAAYIARDSGAVAGIAEDAEGLARLDGAELRHRLVFADLEGLAAEGRPLRDASPGAVREAAEAVDEDDLYTILYTSGTTGPPKGCLVRHRNYHTMAAVVDELPGLLHPDDLMLLYLPLAHNFGRLMLLAGAMCGYTVAFCPDPYAVADALPAVRPTLFPSVPRIYEKVHGLVLAQVAATGGAKGRLARWALGVGREVSVLRERGEAVPAGLARRHAVADRLVFTKIRARLGGRLRLGISGGAPLSAEVARFFHSVGILVLEGYGLSECTTACTVNRPDRYRFGTVGPALPGFELRLADDGEILVRSGTLFAGYLGDPEATAAALPADGWLRTGDVGVIDADGFLSITDRKKDILVTAGGKNVAPANIENALKLSPFVSQALVVGDRRPYLTALISVDQAEVDAWAARQANGGGATPDAVHELVQRVVDEVNLGLARFEQIKRFTILPRDFSPEEGEITPTLKLKRRVCEQHFASDIEALYR